MTHKDLMALADAYAAAPQYFPLSDTTTNRRDTRAALSDALKQVCDDLDAFDKSENSFMRKAIELEAETGRLKKELGVQTYAANNYRRLLDEGDRAYSERLLDIEKLKADNADLRRDEALNEAEAEIEKWKAVHEVNADTLNAMQAEIEQLHKANMELGLENGDLQDAMLKVVQDAERLSEMLDRAFIAHPNLDLDIDAAMKEKP
jgi:chromosome segregation ATPase